MAATSADHLRREIQLILKDADLNSLSSKKVRLILEDLFKCDFSERKKEIDDILMSEITARDVLPIPATRTSEPVDRPSSSIDQTQRPSQDSVDIHADQQTTKSDEAMAMEIHQQENRPSLRRTTVGDGVPLEQSSYSLCKESIECRTEEETVRPIIDNRTAPDLVQQRTRFE